MIRPRRSRLAKLITAIIFAVAAGIWTVGQLREKPREIGGLAGEELAELVVEGNEARGHSFWWEVNGTEDNVFVPNILFKMTIGNGNRKPAPSSLSDGAALGLWDKISSSIRLHQSRPGQAARPMSAGSAPGKRDAQRGT